MASNHGEHRNEEDVWRSDNSYDSDWDEWAEERMVRKVHTNTAALDEEEVDIGSLESYSRGDSSLNDDARYGNEGRRAERTKRKSGGANHLTEDGRHIIKGRKTSSLEQI